MRQKNIKSNMNTKYKTYLKEISNISSGIYLRNMQNGDITYLQIKDLLQLSPGATAIHVEHNPKLTSYILQKGDLLFAGKGTTYLCKIFNLNTPAIPSTAFYTIRLHSDIITPEYLCWYLNHPNIVAKIKTQQVGTSTPMIHKSTLEDLEIIIPDMDTQKNIVALSDLQKRESDILKKISKMKTLITNEQLINILNK